MSKIFSSLKKNNSLIFSDAGATLSWTYQSANLVKNCPPIFTSLNLHAMGYANCAAVGAAIKSKKNIYVIIGDGSLPMNIQELSWCNKFIIKFIIIDNGGYGIIRQTQTDFYNSIYLGSDFKNSKSKLPNFSINKMLLSYNISFKSIQSEKINKKNINWLINNKKSSALILKTNYAARVKLANEQ